MIREKAVFVYKVNVGDRSSQQAKETLAKMMSLYKEEMTFSDMDIKNIIIPVENSDSTVECIYPVSNFSSTHNIGTSKLKFSKVREVKSPTRGTSKSAGVDFYIPEDFTKREILPARSVLIPSGIKVNVPSGYALIAFNKSGIATKKNLQVGACVVDEDYTGEVHIHLTNVGTVPQTIESGDKIVQFILIPVFYAELEEVPAEKLHDAPSERGEGGFGSTGTK